MKYFIRLLLLIILLPSSAICQVSLEKTKSFFPDEKNINQDNIEWKFLNVPEEWGTSKTKKIKIAVAVLKCTSKIKVSNPVLFIEGGPGASGINGIWTWLNHPLRKKNDIILVDIRGTGHSLPEFCPDLGKQFLQILAKNQDQTEDEKQKNNSAIACKEDLVKRGIDINQYNSLAIAQDLHALKEALHYIQWNVYGVSYGTFISQVYANEFPEDIKSLILDSSISDIADYYNNNTTNYITSLEKVFKACKNDTECNIRYPNLEKEYYAVIEKLKKDPITVQVDKKIVKSGTFTYNAEDFKVAIQQSLYDRKLIEILPLLITDFKDRNKNTLSSLVEAFSSALSLDYGSYYCITCKEVLPYNSISAFNNDAAKYKKLDGGLSFYKSDFLVCTNWNSKSQGFSPKAVNLSNLSKLEAPVLVISGEFDPITPSANGLETKKKFSNSFLVSAPTFGHGPGFSTVGFSLIEQFINNKNKKVNPDTFKEYNKVKFINDITKSSGISKLSQSVNNFDVVFFMPFLISIVVLTAGAFIFLYTFIKKRKEILKEKYIRLLFALTTVLGAITFISLALAVYNSLERNFYILLFGLSSQYNYVFVLFWIFLIFTLFSIVSFVVYFRNMYFRKSTILLLISCAVICIYFQYWGFYSGN